MVNESGNGRSATAVNPRTSVLLAAGMGIAAMLGAHAESSTPLTPAPEQRNKPQPSFVPQVQNPRIRWHRLGVYF